MTWPRSSSRKGRRAGGFPQDRPGRLVVLHPRGLAAQEEADCRGRAWRRFWRTRRSSSITRASATEYAVREFSRAGVQLAGGVSAAAARGLEARSLRHLRHGLDFALSRYLGMALAGFVVVVASMVILGLPVPGCFGR